MNEYYFSLYQNENHLQNFTTKLNVVLEMDALEDQGNSRVWYGIFAKSPACWVVAGAVSSQWIVGMLDIDILLWKCFEKGLA